MKQETVKEKAKTPVPQGNNLPAEAHNQAWGLEGTDSRDILIPKLLVMQGLSKLVVEDKAQMGDFVDSVSGEIVGSGREKAPKPVTFIPIKTFKTWVEYEAIQVPGKEAKLEFKGIIPMDEKNANFLQQEEVNGVSIRRDRCINFYVLLADRPDDLPYLLTFRRTSYRTGQKLATHFKKCELAAMRGKPVPPAATMFNMTASKLTNDKGTFYVTDVSPAGQTTPEALKQAYEWFQMLKTASVKVDNSDLAGDPVTEESVDNDSTMDERF